MQDMPNAVSRKAARRTFLRPPTVGIHFGLNAAHSETVRDRPPVACGFADSAHNYGYAVSMARWNSSTSQVKWLGQGFVRVFLGWCLFSPLQRMILRCNQSGGNPGAFIRSQRKSRAQETKSEAWDGNATLSCILLSSPATRNDHRSPGNSIAGGCWRQVASRYS